MATTSKVVVCKNCEARYKVPATFTAQKITCKRCQSPIFLQRRPTTRKRRTVRRYTRVKGNIQPKKASPLHYVTAAISLGLLIVIIVLLAL